MPRANSALARFARFGNQQFRSARLALEACQNGSSHRADRDPDRLPGFDRKVAGFFHGANRFAELAGGDTGPSSHCKELRQEPEASLGTQRGGGAVHELDRQSEVTRRVSSERQELRARGVRVIDVGNFTNPGYDSSPGVDRRGECEDFQCAGIQLVAGDLFDRFDDLFPGCRTGVRPPAAKCGALQ